MKRIPELIVVSTERSGTNFFGSCLRNFHGGIAFFEVFAQDAIYGLQAYPDVAERFSELTGYDARQDQNPDLVAQIHAEPIKYLKLLHQSAVERGGKFFSYKVFPGQIHLSKVKLALSEPGVCVVFLVRCRLDCFISFQKALGLGVWENSDTTGEKISLNLKEFLSWSEERDHWFNNLYRHTIEHDVPRQLLSYEIDIDRPASDVMLRCDLLLKSVGIKAPRKSQARQSVFTKQDHETDPFQKISNGSEVRDALKSADMLSYALSPFLG